MKLLLTELAKQEDTLLNCVNCGFCLPACPTYTRLGDEADSPRGRLRFMRAVVDGRLSPESAAFARHLDRCLGCRACESVCPSGVQYGHLLEGAKEVLAQANKGGILDRVLPKVMATPGLLGPGMFLARQLRETGLPLLLAERLPQEGVLGQIRLGMAMVAATRETELLRRSGGGSVPGMLGSRPPSTAKPSRDGKAGGEEGEAEPWRWSRIADSLGAGRATAVLLGCVQEGLLSRVNRATSRVLRANGFSLVTIPDLGCCGAIHAHTGDLAGARELARKNIRAMEGAEVEAVAVNAAGCGAAMKDYGHLLAEDEEYGARAAHFSSLTWDVSELLGRPGLLEGAPVPLTITYDAPCHLLHAQKIVEEPLLLLNSIPGLRVIPVEKEEECCGGAGVYGISHPELGGAIGRDKVQAVLKTGAELVATGNPGCMMQIGAGLRMAGERVDVVHPIELLDESYRRAGYYEE